MPQCIANGAQEKEENKEFKITFSIVEIMCAIEECLFSPSCLSGGFYFLSSFLTSSYQLACKEEDFRSLT